MTFDQQLQQLNKKKQKLYSQVEVISYTIGEINKQIKVLFDKQYLGRNIKFQYNEAIYFHEDEWKKSIPPDIEFQITEIHVDNQDINFILKNETLGLILIKFIHIQNMTI